MVNNGNGYWFDPIHEEARRISDISYELLNLARAFKRTGNSDAYKELAQVADELLGSQKCITHAIGIHIAEEVKKSEAQTKLVVEATLAGICLAKQT